MWDLFVNRIKRLFVGTRIVVFFETLYPPRLFSSISKRNVRGTKENGYKAVDGSFPLKDPPRLVAARYTTIPRIDEFARLPFCSSIN